MPGALANLDEKVAKLEAAAEACRQATREAHEETKALRQAEKDIRALLGGQTAAGRRSFAQELVEKAIAVALAATCPHAAAEGRVCEAWRHQGHAMRVLRALEAYVDPVEELS